MEKCFDEGTLQAFLDSELAGETSQHVARHVAVCDNCAAALAEIEEETAFVFETLDQELNSLVPTQRLWTKINESIETQKRNRGWWEKVTTFVSGINLLNPQILAFGSLLVVVGVVSVYIVVNKDIATTNVAGTATPRFDAPQTVKAVDNAPRETKTDEKGDTFASLPPVKTQPAVRFERANYSEPVRRGPAKTAAVRDYVRPAVYLDGEESFVNTISRLEKTVNENKDQVLKPSARFSYEKDLAVVDNTINKMKDVVRKNPKNDDAKEILFSSYRNKIELLSSVNRRGEMMASLR